MTTDLVGKRPSGAAASVTVPLPWIELRPYNCLAGCMQLRGPSTPAGMRRLSAWLVAEVGSAVAAEGS
jgi:hypothetical protein